MPLKQEDKQKLNQILTDALEADTLGIEALKQAYQDKLAQRDKRTTPTDELKASDRAELFQAKKELIAALEANYESLSQENRTLYRQLTLQVSRLDEAIHKGWGDIEYYEVQIKYSAKLDGSSLQSYRDRIENEKEKLKKLYEEKSILKGLTQDETIKFQELTNKPTVAPVSPKKQGATTKGTPPLSKKNIKPKDLLNALRKTAAESTVVESHVSVVGKTTKSAKTSVTALTAEQTELMDFLAKLWNAPTKGATTPATPPQFKIEHTPLDNGASKYEVQQVSDNTVIMSSEIDAKGAGFISLQGGFGEQENSGKRIAQQCINVHKWDEIDFSTKAAGSLSEAQLKEAIQEVIRLKPDAVLKIDGADLEQHYKKDKTDGAKIINEIKVGAAKERFKDVAKDKLVNVLKPVLETNTIGPKVEAVNLNDYFKMNIKKIFEDVCGEVKGDLSGINISEDDIKTIVDSTNAELKTDSIAYIKSIVTELQTVAKATAPKLSGKDLDAGVKAAPT